MLRFAAFLSHHFVVLRSPPLPHRGGRWEVTRPHVMFLFKIEDHKWTKHDSKYPNGSLKHVSGFIERAEELKLKGVDEILCLNVNDPFVMKAWAKTYPENNHVKFLVDGSTTYTHALGLELDLKDKGLGVRSRRFSLLVHNLKVKAANLEEGGEFIFSSVNQILKDL